MTRAERIEIREKLLKDMAVKTYEHISNEMDSNPLQREWSFELPIELDDDAIRHLSKQIDSDGYHDYRFDYSGDNVSLQLYW